MPPCRHVLSVDREVDGPEGERLGAAFVGVVGAGLPSLKWDKSTHKGEQECFLPMAGADVMRYHGDPIDVDAVLATAPPEPSYERPATRDPYRALIIKRGLFIRVLGLGKDAIICPFAAEHSEQTSDTASVYFWPHYNGHPWGKIFCFHSHCSDRKQEDYICVLGANPRAVWRGQAGGSASYDDLPQLESYDEDTRRHTASAGSDGGEAEANHNDKHDDVGDAVDDATVQDIRTIRYEPGKLPRNLDEAEAALLVRGGVYQRGSLLVRVAGIPEPGDSIGASPWWRPNDHPTR